MFLRPCATMPPTSANVRSTAESCAKAASERSTIKYLLQLAEDFEEEARRLSGPNG
jgi:hypothetical protein